MVRALDRSRSNCKVAVRLPAVSFNVTTVGKSFTHIWNNLPNQVIDVDCLNSFKARLYKFCMHQEVVWDYKAELSGTRNRSEWVQCD